MKFKVKIIYGMMIFLLFQLKIVFAQYSITETNWIFDPQFEVFQEGMENLELLPQDSLNSKVMIRHYLSRCVECDSEFSRFAHILSKSIGEENTLFVGGNYDFVNEIMAKNLAHRAFGEVIMSNAKFCKLDYNSPPKSYVALINTSGSSVIYVFEDLSEDKVNAIIQDILLQLD